MQKLLINAGLFTLLALLTISLPFIYVSSERYFHHYDLAMYQNMASDMAVSFRGSPLSAIYGVRASIEWSYNQIFTIPLLPFILIFGDSRLVYVTSVALVYMLPFALMSGAIATQLIPSHQGAVFWSTALITLLTPMAWAPTLLGWPDVGAALLIVFAIWLYLQDMTLRHGWRIVLIGWFIGGAVLFRRHFAYGGIAFFTSIGLQALIAFASQLREEPRQAIRVLWKRVVRICLTGAVSFITIAIVSSSFLYNLLTHDSSVHASYVLPIDQNLSFYASQYGWASWVLAIVGFAAGIRTRLLVPPVAIFMLLFGSFSLVQWIFTVRQLGTQYTLHFTLFVVLGLTAVGWIAWITLRGRVRALVVSAAVLCLVFNTVIGLTPADMLEGSRSRPFFSANYRPQVRSDYDEIVRLIFYLRSLAPHQEPIYVAASSRHLNWDLLRTAERTLFGRGETVLNILEIPEVDSYQFYAQPLETLLQAQYVLVATPFQHHLRLEKQQDVVKVVFVAFTENWEIARDFIGLPVQFQLANGIVVNVYKRTRATSLGTALRTLEAMKTFVGTPLPDRQIDWINLSQRFSASIRKNRDHTYSIWIGPGNRGSGPTESFLYLGMLPEHVKIAGKSTFNDDRCSGVVLRFSMINAQYRIIDSVKIERRLADVTDFALTLQAEDATYLLLTIFGVDDHCSLQIDHLKVSTIST